jgi:hypothetical protein
MSRPLDGYPDSWGAQRAAVVPHTGPASYTQVTPGTPPAVATGGDTMQAVSAGMKFIDFIGVGVTDSGNYRVEGIPKGRSGGATGQQTTSYTLRWIAARTASLGGQSQVVGTEAISATDLSAEIVRLLVIGPK